MDIIASDALKNTKWGHMVKTKLKVYCLSHTHKIKFTPPDPPSSLIYIRNDTLLNYPALFILEMILY